MAKLLTFTLLPTDSKRVTHIWSVTGRGTEHHLGVVRWKNTWRRFVFEPFDFTVFDAGCLRELADFCVAATEKHKVSRRPLTRREYAAKFP